MQGEAEISREGEDISIDVVLEQLDQGLARNALQRRGALVGVLESVYGLGRQGR